MSTEFQRAAVASLMSSLNNEALPPGGFFNLTKETGQDLLSYVRDLERDNGRHKMLYEKHKQDGAEHYQRYKTAETYRANVEKELNATRAKLVKLENAHATLEADFEIAMKGKK